MLISEFDYDLPPEQIAQVPLPERDASRMLLLDRVSGAYHDSRFAEFPAMLRGDELVVVNNVRVLPARLFGRRLGVHAQPAGREGDRESFLHSRIEVLLLRRVDSNLWEALVRPGRKVRTGERLTFGGASQGEELHAEVVGRGPLGLRKLRFYGVEDPSATIERIGHMPLPPYIRRADEPADRDRYQTVFAKEPGAIAAPTAGLHFTSAILEKVRARGVDVREITLEVGLGTFQPVYEENLESHKIHSESYQISAETAEAINAAKRTHRPICAVGTTVVRALEDAATEATKLGQESGRVAPGPAVAEIFIQPGHPFAVVDHLLTNFHLPRSTLLVLVAAFAGREAVLAAYRHAVASGYRFYSYGDCMLIR
jgi:S-adenosylmethionine:tRNA ribosyltransferase-isomerase